MRNMTDVSLIFKRELFVFSWKAQTTFILPAATLGLASFPLDIEGPFATGALKVNPAYKAKANQNLCFCEGKPILMQYNWKVHVYLRMEKRKEC